MAEKTMTKVQKFDAIAKAIDGMNFPFDAQAFLTHEIEMTNKRNARKSTAPTAKQKANAEIAEKIKDLLAENEKMTATEIAKALDLSSPQKVVGVVRQTTGVTTVSEKRVTYYTLE